MDRVLLAALHLRTNLTERQLADLFGISNGAAHRTITDLAGALANLLGPGPTDRRELWVVDGTLVPVRDRSKTAKSKNYRRSVNVQVVARRRDRRVVAVSESWPGNRNDVVVFRETLAGTLPARPRLIGDGGYRGAPGVVSPTRGPDGRIVRDASWHRFRKRRATAEHVLAELKVWRILRDCRRRGEGIDLAVRGVAALCNLRIETR